MHLRPGHAAQVSTASHLVRSAAWTLLSCWGMKGGYSGLFSFRRAASHEQPLSLLLWSLIVFRPLSNILPLCSHFSPPLWRKLEGRGAETKWGQKSNQTIGLFFWGFFFNTPFIRALMEKWSSSPNFLLSTAPLLELKLFSGPAHLPSPTGLTQTHTWTYCLSGFAQSLKNLNFFSNVQSRHFSIFLLFLFYCYRIIQNIIAG